MIAEKGLQAHTSWVNKIVQLYETYLVRHGIMVVGPAGSGEPPKSHDFRWTIQMGNMPISKML